MASTLPPLITIVGPTASGKTDLAVELAKKFEGEIVNADSRQIYKEINIASAKPKLITDNLQLTTYQGIPHHLFNLVRPDEEFNVTHFKTLAIEIINDIHKRGTPPHQKLWCGGKLPFLVGGTGLWISAVVDNLDFPDVPPNPEFRTHPSLTGASELLPSREGTQRGVSITIEQLYQELISKDPDAAKFVNAKNRRRIIRALEVIDATSKPFSAQRTKGPPLFRILELGITRPIKELEQRIAKRIEEQVETGLEEEVRNLFSRYDPRLPALSSISVREWKEYFDGTQPLNDTLRLIRLHNRQYAKRQMTWFKRDTRIQWIQNKNEASSLIRQFTSFTPDQVPSD